MARWPVSADRPAYRPGSADELAALVRDAHDSRTPLRIAGRGGWLAAGGPVRTDAARLDVALLAGIVEYVPGDLTLTARAGTTLAELDATTARHGQWCPLLPFGDDDATLGAVFATASAGPFARSLGAPRDLALGLEFVDGTGRVARGGGRVVKNVAGFDLTRLLVGSWGTLGVITEVTVRLRARPRVDETWALALDPADAAASRALDALDALERGPLAPLAIARLSERACAALALPHDRRVLARLGGNASFVAAARAALRALGDAERSDAAIWSRVRALGGDDPAPSPRNALADPVSQRIKRLSDPGHILNPGILGEPLS